MHNQKSRNMSIAGISAILLRDLTIELWFDNFLQLAAGLEE